MNITMKQRLVGTIVIGCLAIIFIPILLDGEGVAPPQLNNEIPQRPEVPAVPEVEPVRPVVLSDELTASSEERVQSDTEEAIIDERTGTTGNTGENEQDQPQSQPEGVVSENIDTPQLNEAGLPEAWSVRLGSFADKKNADALIERLQARQYKGFGRPIETSNRGILNGVYVGPVLTRGDANELRDELAETFDLQGVVVQFAIEEMQQ